MQIKTRKGKYEVLEWFKNLNIMIQQHNSLCQGEKKYIIGLKKKKSE